MKIIEKVLKDKLSSMGYQLDKLNEQLNNIDFEIIDSQIALESEADNFINVIEYTRPTAEIARALVNYSKHYIQSIIIEGEIKFATSPTSIGSNLPTADYRLDQSVCILATTSNLKVEILKYVPAQDVMMRYNGMTYETAFAEDRNKIAKEYYEAFVENGRVVESKVRDILAVLILEHIIDDLAINGDNPRIKMYDNPDAYAENITEYKIKYINRKTNKIELAHKPIYIRRLGANVSVGSINNDAYIKLSELPEPANFPLNAITCYWTSQPNAKRDEVAIYIATKRFDDCVDYRQYRKKYAVRYDEIAESLLSQFQREGAISASRIYILEVLNKLNPELLNPSMDIIRDCMPNPADPVDAIKYKFKAVPNPADFEEQLYISIEDNIGRRYKYKLTENVLEDFTRIGNKLAYTGEDGQMIKKQSVADFNINMPTSIIRRETLIDDTKIPGLLGYIYEDVEYIGTEMLPVPNLEVDFYFPAMIKTEVAMFNGTSFDANDPSFTSGNRFDSANMGADQEVMPGSTYAIVRYLNSRGEILKENKVTNLFPGATFVPEIIPIINDVNGGEWMYQDAHYPSAVVNTNPDLNTIEIKYVEKNSKVTLTFLNREGKKIADDIIETAQAGTIYDISQRGHFVDESNNNWKLVATRPQKLMVKDDDKQNTLILIYDIEKETVRVRFLTPLGKSIIADYFEDVARDKKFTYKVEKVLLDEDGKGWIYDGPNPISIVARKGEPNLIEVNYQEHKLPVIIKYQSEDGFDVTSNHVEILQVGTKFAVTMEDKIVDVNCKKWELVGDPRREFVVTKDESANVLKVTYRPATASVTVQYVNEEGKKIINPLIKRGQIGGEFNVASVDEVPDNFGKLWKIAENPAPLIISENDAENNITIKYKPLIANIEVRFYDDERNELIPRKKYQRQAGTMFKPEIIQSLESPDGRKWIINQEKIPDHNVGKNDEENIVSIFYNKDVADVKIEFYDAYQKKLKDAIIIKEQIGATFEGKSYLRITDNDGGKWMLETSEPKKMIVKERDNNFRLIYGEVKAIVLVKCVDVNTNKSLIDDLVAKVKLGGMYIPNISETLFDAEKCLWKFIGDKNISLAVKENEQENIIILQYDEALARVNVKYQDEDHNTLRKDVSYEMQIGKPIDHKKLDQFIADDGLGWAFENSKATGEKVVESGNEVVNIFKPLEARATTRFVSENNEDIIDPQVKNIQVGKAFKPEFENRVYDIKDRLWQHLSTSEEETKMLETGNTIFVKYAPVLADVVERFIGKNGETIANEVTYKIQVGEEHEFDIAELFEDDEGKKWDFAKIDRSSIRVKEDAEKNIINKFYAPRLREVLLKAFDLDGKEIMNPIKKEAQVGSNYKAELPATYIDSKTKLGWKLPEKYDDTIKIDEDANKNVIEVKYQKYMATVTDRLIDESGNILVPDETKELQVGTAYGAETKDVITDKDGKEWLCSKKQDSKFLSSKQTITVSENAEENIVPIKYTPSLAKVIVKYQNTLGETIASNFETQAQIGSEYTPEIKETIVDNKKNKWTYNPNSKSTIKIAKDVSKNIITLSYEEEKAPIIYKYRDEFDNRLRSPKKKLAQIGSICIPEIENVIEDEHGRVWEFKASSVDKIEVKDSNQENIVEITYVPLLVDVAIIQRNLKGDIIARATEKAQLGSKFKPTISDDVFDDNSLMYRFKKCVPEELEIKEVPLGSEEEVNLFEQTYAPVFGNISIMYCDLDGNRLRDDDTVQLQVGTKYTPKLVQFVNDKNGVQWENISKEVDTIRVKENDSDNIIKMTFELAKAEVFVRFKDIDGNTVKESERFTENIGVEFIPKVEQSILDAKNRKWIFSYAQPSKITVGSINNNVDLIYQESKVKVTIRYETPDGKKLRDDTIEKVQEGVQYVPKKNFPVIYDQNEIWRYLEFKPASLLVTANEAENIIVQIYDNQNEGMKETKKTIENPFANTLTEEEKAIEKQLEERKAEKVETTSEEKADAQASEFEESNLVALSKLVVIGNAEKPAIIKLNNINKDVVKALEEFKSNFAFDKTDELVRKLDSLMQEEKDIIEKDHVGDLSSDKSGKKFMKILEAIVKNDVAYQSLQERKTILLTDYFVNVDVSLMEQANYICERAKNNIELEVLEDMIKNGGKQKDQMIAEYISLVYEKAMLNNYYKTRTKVKDEFFKDESQKNSLDVELITMVTNMLPKQAYKLLLKDDKLMLAGEVELRAILKLLNAPQKSTLDKLIDETKDQRLKKSMQKKLKSIK